MFESNSGWGANLDMVGLAHGPVGCGVFTQASRLNVPEFVQGIESFTALHACTNLGNADLEDGGNTKLTRALAEIDSLFPLARGVTLLCEDPIEFIDANVTGVAKATTRETGKLIVPLTCENIRGDSNWAARTATSLKAALTSRSASRSTHYDIALPFHRQAAGLVWILAKLLRDIGLEPVHEITGSSTSDMARVARCNLVVGFAPKLDVPMDYFAGGAAQMLRQWFGMDLVWTCFASPSATDASLRLIAVHFDQNIRERAEQVIAANRQKVDAVIARYRPRLQGKLILHFWPMTEEEIEPYRLLGFRIGNASGWPGKTGKWRTPRLVCEPEKPSEKAMDSYIAESKPDLVLDFWRDDYEWRKRGQTTLPASALYAYRGNVFWAYDGFACLAAALDRAVNAPWRKLVVPPWPVGGG